MIPSGLQGEVESIQCGSCRWGLQFLEETRHEYIAKWSRCPMRGRRLVELAAGDFDCMFHKLCRVTAAGLLEELPRDISSAEKATCLHALETGRSHLLFVFSVKLAGFCVPPLLLHAAAHWDLQKARHALRTCARSSCPHPRVAMLREPSMAAEVEAFLDGAELLDMAALPEFIAELRFGFCSERVVEGGHATVHLAARGSRRRTEAYDSLSLRLPEVKASLMQQVA